MRIGKRKLSGRDSALLLLALALCLGAATVFKTCGPREDGTWMSCHDADQAVIGIGAALAVLALLRLPARGKGKIALDALIAALAAAAAIIPGNIIPLCMMRTMRCHVLFRPAVIVLGALIVAAAGWDVFKTLKKER